MKTSRTESPRFILAFTLIELLVVIAIIAILAAMLFPAIGVAKRKAQEASARVDMQNIGTGIAKYEADYNGRFPAPNIPTGTDDVTFGISTAPLANMEVISVPTNSGVMAILMSVEKFNNGVNSANLGHVLNPRRIPYVNAKPTSDTNSGGLGPDGEYRDPWGSPYVISMDTSLDENCRDVVYSRAGVSQDTPPANNQRGYYGMFNPNVGTAPNQFRYNAKFLIWSRGADTRFNPAQNAKTGDNKDNLLGWQ